MKTPHFLGIFLLVACQQQTLYEQYPLTRFYIEHQWQEPSHPQGIRLLLFSHFSLPGFILQNIHPERDSLLLIPGTYKLISVSNDSEFLRIRDEDSWEHAQVYIPPVTRISCDWTCSPTYAFPAFYTFASSCIEVGTQDPILKIRASNMIRTFYIRGNVLNISEITSCKGYLGGMIGARTLHDGAPAGVPGVQAFSFQILDQGIRIRLPSLGDFPEAPHPLTLDFSYPNGAIKRFVFDLNLHPIGSDTIYLPDIELPTQTIGGGNNEGFQGFVNEWGWTSVPIDFD